MFSDWGQTDETRNLLHLRLDFPKLLQFHLYLTMFVIIMLVPNVVEPDAGILSILYLFRLVSEINEAGVKWSFVPVILSPIPFLSLKPTTCSLYGLKRRRRRLFHGMLRLSSLTNFFASSFAPLGISIKYAVFAGSNEMIVRV